MSLDQMYTYTHRTRASAQEGKAMEEFKAGEQVWLVITEYEEGFSSLVQGGTIEAQASEATSVAVAQATVLEGEEMAALEDGRRFDLLLVRVFRSAEEAQRKAKELAAGLGKDAS